MKYIVFILVLIMSLTIRAQEDNELLRFYPQTWDKDVIDGYSGLLPFDKKDSIGTLYVGTYSEEVLELDVFVHYKLDNKHFFYLRFAGKFGLLELLDSDDMWIFDPMIVVSKDIHEEIQNINIKKL